VQKPEQKNLIVSGYDFPKDEKGGVYTRLASKIKEEGFEADLYKKH
jgi:hypothetical protein